MTYYIFIIFSVIFSLFSLRKLSTGFTDVFALLVFFMIFVFSQSDNFDHLNYQMYYELEVYGLFEPLFVLLMYIFNGIVEPRFFLCTVFFVVYMLCRFLGDNNYNLLVLLFLSPLGVVSPRFFFAAMLLSILVKNSRSFIRYLFPVFIHYSAAPVYSFFIFERRIFVFLILSFVCFFALAKNYFFNFISSFGIDYFRYLESTNSFSITNIAKYSVLPLIFLMIGKRIMVQRKYYSIALYLFVAANIVKFGMLNFEVMSRVATMFVLLGLYYVYKHGNDLARFFVICYLILNSIMFGFFGWAIYPDIYLESDQWLSKR